jgi:glutamate N-acetyltransferase / amino-acid N-acetyltransferase
MQILGVIMANYIPSNFFVPGFKAAGISAGIKKVQAKDFGLLYSETPAVAAGVFTLNRVKAAPVLISKERLKSGRAQAILVNSGSANACTGRRGLEDGRRLSRLLAAALKTSPENILLASTGVIGKPLPMAQMESNLPILVSSLSPMGMEEAAKAIMTTDTFPKAAIIRSRMNGKEVTLAGIAKGAGMIAPHMATLLSFVLTDVAISPPALRRALKDGVEESFNRITVDGDTSTNDTLLVLANGKSGIQPLKEGTPGFKHFSSLLSEILLTLAKMIARDGEGATKLVEVIVENARTKGEAQIAARAIAESPLVKTAFFGTDANWGRIICAAGYSGAAFDPDKVDIFFDQVDIARRGQSTGLAKEELATAVMKKNAYTVRVNLHQGKASASIFTTDFSLDYVKINASYRS